MLSCDGEHLLRGEDRSTDGGSLTKLGGRRELLPSCGIWRRFSFVGMSAGLRVEVRLYL
jgi:hypothetical protein